MKQLLLVALLGFWATGSLAHSPLQTTVPANETTVSEAPSEITMGFKGGIRLTRISMRHADHASVDLDLDGFKGFISDYVIPLQAMGPGVYIIEWRGLGSDGHAMNGSFRFTVE
ncbi:copper resistance CopC family protein [Planktotalea sp.]|uniref:copper resistance CopC family protein n=1 Tax=Planktotalea sp. TaxID=2029877 RepID=UPI003296FE25